MRTGLWAVLTVLLAGLPVLIGRWRPRWRILATSEHCSLREATRYFERKREALLWKNKIFSRILIVKTESLEVSVVEIQQEEVGREFPAEF